MFSFFFIFQNKAQCFRKNNVTSTSGVPTRTSKPLLSAKQFEGPLNTSLFLTIVSSMSCQKSLHKYFGSPNIDFFWHWIYFYCSHLVAINISNSNLLIQGIFFKLSVTLSIFYSNEKNKLGPRI